MGLGKRSDRDATSSDINRDLADIGGIFVLCAGPAFRFILRVCALQVSQARPHGLACPADPSGPALGRVGQARPCGGACETWRSQNRKMNLKAGPAQRTKMPPMSARSRLMSEEVASRSERLPSPIHWSEGRRTPCPDPATTLPTREVEPDLCRRG